MNIARSKYRKISVMLLLLILVISLMPISAFAAESTATATISVEKQITGDKPQSAETFTFTLTPDDASYPMPEGENGGTLTIKGAGTASFGSITYTEPKNYTYTLKETTGNAANYTYDKTVYKATVYVTTDDNGNLTAKVWIFKDGSDAKAENATFVNTYTKPGKPEDPPQTGDSSNPALWISLAGFSATMLIIIAASGFRKKKKQQQP